MRLTGFRVEPGQASAGADPDIALRALVKAAGAAVGQGAIVFVEVADRLQVFVQRENARMGADPDLSVLITQQKPDESVMEQRVSALFRHRGQGFCAPVIKVQTAAAKGEQQVIPQWQDGAHILVALAQIHAFKPLFVPDQPVEPLFGPNPK